MQAAEIPSVRIFSHDLAYRDGIGGESGMPGHDKFTSKLLSIATQGMTTEKTDQTFTLYDYSGVARIDGEGQRQLKKELGEVVVESMVGVEPGTGEAQRLYESTYTLLQAVSKSPYISGTNKAYFLDLVRWSIESSRHPDLIGQTTIRVGFGGSDDEHLAMRHPAYLLPALDFWNRLNTLSQSRLQKAKVQYIYDGLDIDSYGDDTMPEKRKKSLMNEHAQEIVASRDFDDHDLAELTERYKDRFGLFVPPSIEFLFAYHAGIQINHKDPVRTKQQAKRSIQLVQSFIQRFAPEALPYVHMRIDEEETVTDEYAPLLLGYLTQLVEDAYQKPEYARLRDDLQQLAINHGKPQGYAAEHIHEEWQDSRTNKSELQKSIEYAVKHVYFFQDRVRIPSASYITGKDSSLVSISIGGRPERLFNEIRQLISEQASPSGFLEFARQQYSQDAVSAHQIAVVERWYSLYQHATYTQGTIQNDWLMADLPLITLPLMTDIGRCPVYYARKFDALIVAGDIEKARAQGIRSVIDEKFSGTTDGSVKDKLWHEAVSRDMDALLSLLPESDILDFYEQFLDTP